jgi:hypothetical protein
MLLGDYGDQQQIHTHLNAPSGTQTSDGTVQDRVTEPPEYAGSSLETMSLAILVSTAPPPSSGYNTRHDCGPGPL